MRFLIFIRYFIEFFLFKIIFIILSFFSIKISKKIFSNSFMFIGKLSKYNKIAKNNCKFVFGDFSEKEIISTNTKHIIVATGGSNRILKGLLLTQIENGRKMLITGVGKGIQKEDIAKAILANEDQKKILNCCVDLGLSALNTQGNAYEAYQWLKNHKAQSSFLVTANYHMPRLILEFKKIAPEIKGCDAAIILIWLSTDKNLVPILPHIFAQSYEASSHFFYF